ncbi:MAG: hypothetical protein V4463_06255 [Pseudomonadota bacterium]
MPLSTAAMVIGAAAAKAAQAIRIAHPQGKTNLNSIGAIPGEEARHQYPPNPVPLQALPAKPFRAPPGTGSYGYGSKFYQKYNVYYLHFFPILLIFEHFVSGEIDNNLPTEIIHTSNRF